MGGKRISLKDIKKIHFIGIGGAGMSAIARVLLEMGYEVSGSDIKESRFILSLREKGVKIKIGHQEENIFSADIVVYSSAIPQNNCELQKARRDNIIVLPRAKMLALLGEGKKTIAVAGTHGKTTTTSMISFMFKQLGLDPTFLIGGELNDIGSNASYGKGDFFIAEADESDGSFLFLKPYIAVVTNIEADHLDYYKSFSQIEEHFVQFLNNLLPQGAGIICGDDFASKAILKKIKKRYLRYGIGEENDFYAQEIELKRWGSIFQFFAKGKKVGRVTLKVPGLHNICNSLAALAAGSFLDLNFSDMAESLAQFSGVQRRFENKGSFNGILVVDDYAHHPSEVKATLKAAQNGDWERIICVFQPHRYSRTKFLGKDFAHSFEEADWVILTDVYSAGEEPIPGVSGKVILDALLTAFPQKKVAYFPRIHEIKKFLTFISRPGDLILTLGAGDITLLGEDFLSYVRKISNESRKN